ncbi:MAG TPA: LysR substrate-binding domain-containing protein, partial [Saccharospirillum sp.]|nr:LysR substrate-binding domain-containing protein [Saccharospirillum sp.]
RYMTSSMANLKHAALQGLGVVALPTYVCSDSVASGALHRLLPEWHVGRPQISLLMPSRRGQLPAVKALSQALAQHFERIDER